MCSIKSSREKLQNLLYFWNKKNIKLLHSLFNSSQNEKLFAFSYSKNFEVVFYWNFSSSINHWVNARKICCCYVHNECWYFSAHLTISLSFITIITSFLVSISISSKSSAKNDMMVLLCLHIRQWKNLETDRTCTTAVGSVLKKKVQNIMESCENEKGIWISALVDIILYVCLKNLDCWKSKSISHAEGSSKSFKRIILVYILSRFPGILNVSRLHSSICNFACKFKIPRNYVI